MTDILQIETMEEIDARIERYYFRRKLDLWLLAVVYGVWGFALGAWYY